MTKPLKKYKKRELIEFIEEYQKKNNLLRNKLINKEKELMEMTEQLQDMDFMLENEETEIVVKKEKKKTSKDKTIDYIKKRIEKVKDEDLLKVYQNELNRLI